MTRHFRSTVVAVLLAMMPAVALAQNLRSPSVATRPANDNSDFAASTLYVDNSAQVLLNAISAKAPKAAPTFSGLVTVLENLAYTSDGSRNWNWTTGQMQYNVNGATKFWLTDAGNIVSVGSSIRLAAAGTPATAATACNGGTIQWDAGFVYLCTATDTWKRAALTTWTGAGVADGVWQTYTPTVGCGSGGLTSAAFSGRYGRVGKTVTVNLQLNTAASGNGTCAGNISMSLPTAVQSTSVGTGRETVGGKTLVGTALINATAATITNTDNTFPGGNSTNITVTLTYESKI